jgi:hypothetical protein
MYGGRTPVMGSPAAPRCQADGASSALSGARLTPCRMPMVVAHQGRHKMVRPGRAATAGAGRCSGGRPNGPTRRHYQTGVW